LLEMTSCADKGMRGWIMEPVMHQGSVVLSRRANSPGTTDLNGYRAQQRSFPQQ
jgi:hypothetical protein